MAKKPDIPKSGGKKNPDSKTRKSTESLQVKIVEGDRNKYAFEAAKIQTSIN